MFGRDVEPFALLPVGQVQVLRDQYQRHRPHSLDRAHCWVCPGEWFPCRARREASAWLAAAGYKTEPGPMDERLALADELYLVGHDSVNGNGKRPARVTGLGLGAALLAEFVLSGVVAVTEAGTLAVIAPGRPTGTTAGDVLTDIRRERHPVRTWIEYVGQTATAVVAARLVESGWLRRAGSRLLRGVTRWEPTNMTHAGWRSSRLKILCVERLPVEVPDLVLMGLVDAAGLGDPVFGGLDHRELAYRDAGIVRLPTPYRALTRELAGLVGDAVVSPRT